MKTLFLSLFAAAIVVLCNSTLRADWQNIPVSGGTITSFASDGMYVYVSTDTGGVFRSLDHGATWEAANSGLPDKGVVAIQSNGSTLFAAMKNGFGGAIFISSDHGTTWVAPTTPYFGFVFCLLPYGSATLAGTWYGVAKSTDNGNSWPTMNDNGLPSNAGVTALAVSGTKIFAGVSESSVGGTGVFLTTNNGTSWVEKNTGLANTLISALAINGTTVFAGTNDGLYTSIDNGAHWTLTTGGPSGMIYSIVSVGSTVFATSTAGIYSTTTMGASWTNIGANVPTGSTLTAIGIAGNQLLVGDNNSLWKRPLGEVAAVSYNGSDRSVTLWPNPARGAVHLSIAELENIDAVSIIDMNGINIPIKLQRSTPKSLTIEFGTPPAGIYLLHLQTSTGTRTQKIVVE